MITLYRFRKVKTSNVESVGSFVNESPGTNNRAVFRIKAEGANLQYPCEIVQ